MKSHSGIRIFFFAIVTLWAFPFAALVEAQGEASAVTDAARKASIKRQDSMDKTRRLMLEGDKRQGDRDYAGAYDIYQQAFLEAPVYAAAREIRMLAFSKYQESLRLYADELARQGRVEDALKLVQGFYRDAQQNMVPANAIDRKTAFLLEDLKSGEKYEPGQSPVNLQRVDRVRELFTLADAAAQLGRYDEATEHYAEILSFDPYNRAARRGLEAVDKLINAYHQAAYDSTRATMLADVSALWENPVPRLGISGLPDAGFRSLDPTEKDSIRSKLSSIIIPEVEFVSTPLRDALLFLSQRSRQIDPARKGVDIVLSANSAGSGDLPITLRLRNIPLGTVLDYTTQLARMKYRIDQYAITVVPLTAPDDESLITKRYRVPPDFISGGSLGGGGDDPFGGGADPFADLGGAGAGGGALQPKLTAMEFLKNNGIQFPNGASATFFPETSTLLVHNTQTQMDLLETLIDASFGSVAQLLRFDVKVLDITESHLQEIGFDWLLGQFNVGSSEKVFASGGTEGNASSGTNSDDFPFVAPGATLPVGDNPVTAGNRSGAVLPDTIDSLLVTGSDNSGGSSTGKAPGTFALAGVFTDPQFQVVLRSLSQTKGVDLASNISVLSRAGQIASVKSVREFIYPTEYDPPEIPDNIFANITVVGAVPAGVQSTQPPVTPANPTAFEMRELGSTVEIEGVIGPDGETISVTLNPEVVEFEGFINYGTPYRQVRRDGSSSIASDNDILMPIFNTLRNTTTVEVYDGQTIVIGGLLNEQRGMVQDKVPFLGDVPVLGKFFTTNAQQSDRRALVFFVTVKVVDPSGTAVKERTAQASL